MLYKLVNIGTKTTFVKLNARTMHDEGFLEKQMEQWLADNPTAVLPEDEAQVLVISQESHFENMTDVLAIDGQGNLVVIEIKRGQSPRDVIAQALEYASEIATWDYSRLNDRAMRYFAQRGHSFSSLVDAFGSTFGIDRNHLSEDSFNSSQRIFIVSETIDFKVERTAQWLIQQGVQITCLAYDCYVSNDAAADVFLDFNEVANPNQARSKPSARSAAGRFPETEAVEQMPPDIRAAYDSLRSHAIGFGDDVEIYATGANIILRANRVFAEIPRRRRGSKLAVRVRPEGFGLAEREADLVDGVKVKRYPDTHGWTLNHELEIDENTNITHAARLLRRSYNAASAR
jgi:uncharacterized protein (DUF1499 family)